MNCLYYTHVSLCMSALSRCSSLAWRTDDSGAHFTRTGELLLRTRTSREHNTRPAKTGDNDGGAVAATVSVAGGEIRTRNYDSEHDTYNTHAVIVRGIVGVSAFLNHALYVFTWFKCVRPKYHPDSGGSIQRRNRKVSTLETINFRSSTLIRQPFFSFLILFPSPQLFHLLKRFSFFALTLLPLKKQFFLVFAFFFCLVTYPVTYRGSVRQCSMEQ